MWKDGGNCVSKLRLEFMCTMGVERGQNETERDPRDCRSHYKT